jgi:hypothetical protein
MYFKFMGGSAAALAAVLIVAPLTASAYSAIGSCQTSNGPKTEDQMRSELKAAGFSAPDPAGVLWPSVYARTTGSSVTCNVADPTFGNQTLTWNGQGQDVTAGAGTQMASAAAPAPAVSPASAGKGIVIVYIGGLNTPVGQQAWARPVPRAGSELAPRSYADGSCISGGF